MVGPQWAHRRRKKLKFSERALSFAVKLNGFTFLFFPFKIIAATAHASYVWPLWIWPVALWQRKKNIWYACTRVPPKAFTADNIRYVLGGRILFLKSTNLSNTSLVANVSLIGIIAPFTKTRNLKFTTQLTIAIFLVPSIKHVITSATNEPWNRKWMEIHQSHCTNLASWPGCWAKPLKTRYIF